MGRRWCRTDPVVRIGKENGKLTLFAPIEYKTGLEAIILHLGVPEGTNVASSQNKVLGGDFSVLVTKQPKLSVWLDTEADDSFPLIVMFDPAGSHDLPTLIGVGLTNEIIDLIPVEP